MCNDNKLWLTQNAYSKRSSVQRVGNGMDNYYRIKIFWKEKRWEISAFMQARQRMVKNKEKQVCPWTSREIKIEFSASRLRKFNPVVVYRFKARVGQQEERSAPGVPSPEYREGSLYPPRSLIKTPEALGRRILTPLHTHTRPHNYEHTDPPLYVHLVLQRTTIPS